MYSKPHLKHTFLFLFNNFIHQNFIQQQRKILLASLRLLLRLLSLSLLLLLVGFAVGLLLSFESDAAAIEEGDDVVELVAQAELAEVLVDLIELDWTVFEDEFLDFLVGADHVVEGDVEGDGA
jgi:hypothetical protein